MPLFRPLSPPSPPLPVVNLGGQLILSLDSAPLLPPGILTPHKTYRTKLNLSDPFSAYGSFFFSWIPSQGPSNSCRFLFFFNLIFTPPTSGPFLFPAVTRFSPLPGVPRVFFSISLPDTPLTRLRCFFFPSDFIFVVPRRSFLLLKYFPPLVFCCPRVFSPRTSVTQLTPTTSFP